jgi:hypothetical protein
VAFDSEGDESAYQTAGSQGDAATSSGTFGHLDDIVEEIVDEVDSSSTMDSTVRPEHHHGGMSSNGSPVIADGARPSTSTEASSRQTKRKTNACGHVDEESALREQVRVLEEQLDAAHVGKAGEARRGWAEAAEVASRSA